MVVFDTLPADLSPQQLLEAEALAVTLALFGTDSEFEAARKAVAVVRGELPREVVERVTRVDD
jgi:hypothetical protein